MCEAFSLSTRAFLQSAHAVNFVQFMSNILCYIIQHAPRSIFHIQFVINCHHQLNITVVGRLTRLLLQQTISLVFYTRLRATYIWLAVGCRSTAFSGCSMADGVMLYTCMTRWFDQTFCRQKPVSVHILTGSRLVTPIRMIAVPCQRSTQQFDSLNRTQVLTCCE